MTLPERLARYTPVRLEADLSGLSENERRMVALLIEAADRTDDLFWVQAWGPRGLFLEKLTSEEERRFALINYGPWDRLSGDEPWLEGTGPKPPGANLYPPDLTREEFEAASADILSGRALDALYERATLDSPLAKRVFLLPDRPRPAPTP